MFGYIIAEKSELRIKEYDIYKAVYCSLCKTLGKKYGVISRFTLSYDFTFLGLLNLSLSDGCNEIKKGRCVYNPLKKCNFLTDGKENKNGKKYSGNKEIEFSAACAALLLYFKFEDNIKDEKGIKKLFYKILCAFHKPYYKKAAKEYPELNKTFKKYIDMQFEAENKILEFKNVELKKGLYNKEDNKHGKKETYKNGLNINNINRNNENNKNNEKNNFIKDNLSDDSIIDFAAEPTAVMMKEVFSSLAKDEFNKKALSVLGYNLGKWIYLTDCLADIEKDFKLNRFNPIIIAEFKKQNFKPETEYAFKRLKNTLLFCSLEASKAFELLTIYKYKNILGNIIYLGMPKAIELLKKEKNK